MSTIDLSVVIPIYNDAESVRPFLKRLYPVLETLNVTYEIIFCLDPSPDNTQEVIETEIQRNSKIKLLLLSRRFGQPAATMAGILNSNGKVCVIIDVDLQDPPELIEALYHKLNEGYEVVYAKRKSRKGETFFKKLISHLGYKIINKMSDVKIPKDTGDFRIITRRVIEELRKLNETHGFLRGLVAYVGFKQTFIEYERNERIKGKGHYNPYLGSLKIGLNGLIGFSSKPLQFMSISGACFAGLSFLLGLWYVLQKLIHIDLTPGLPTTVLVVTFFAGIQLLSLGLMGEYISRIYEEVKGRPLYILDKIITAEDNKT